MEKQKSRKLSLGKESIRDLDREVAGLLAGGSISYHCSPFPSYAQCDGTGWRCY